MIDLGFADLAHIIDFDGTIMDAMKDGYIITLYSLLTTLIELYYAKFMRKLNVKTFQVSSCIPKQMQAGQ